MTWKTHGQTNRLLGYPEDARLLIVNADDFGMCNATNEAIIQALHEGLVQSTSLMVPCPWASHAMRFLHEHPEISFGVHLTVLSDAVDYYWGPITCCEKVPTLVNQSGYFYRYEQMNEFLDRVDLLQLEVEFRAQIERVLEAGLKPAQLDWHTLRINGRHDIYDLMFRLAREYRLALRVFGKSFISKLQSQGFPTNDYDFLDSSSLDPATKASRYAMLLRTLPPGLSEWAVHPGIDCSELQALEPDGNHFRQTDYDFWVSQQAKDLIDQEGIILLDYRALQDAWNAV